MSRNPIANSKLDDPMHRSSALRELNGLIKKTERRLRELQHARAAIEGLEVAAQMLSGMATTEEFLDKCVDLRMKLTPLTVGDMDYMTGLVVESPEPLDKEFDDSFMRPKHSIHENFDGLTGDQAIDNADEEDN